MGGVSGLVSIVFQLTGRGQFLPFGTMVIMLNVPILILGWIYISTGFVWRSIIGTPAYSLVIDLVEPVMPGWSDCLYHIRFHGREMGARIMSQLERGVTALHGEGFGNLADIVG